MSSKTVRRKFDGTCAKHPAKGISLKTSREESENYIQHDFSLPVAPHPEREYLNVVGIQPTNSLDS